MRVPSKYIPLYSLIEEIRNIGYSSWHLLCSPVLAMVGLSELFQKYADEDYAPKSGILLLKNLIIYYLKNSTVLFLHLLCKVALTLSRYCVKLDFSGKYLVDCYYVLTSGNIGIDCLNKYFPGVEEYFKKYNWAIVIWPRFLGSRNPYRYYREFIFLRRNNRQVLTEFQLLWWRDYLILFWHVLVYPLYVFGLWKDIPKSREGDFLKHAFVEQFVRETVGAAARFLAAKRLSPALPAGMRCLQWFENQALERTFNKGIRSVNNDIHIYGAQLLICPVELINMHVARCRRPELYPDKILVNGLVYIHEDSTVKCEVGPSLRYAEVFKPKPRRNSDSILVILPYFTDVAVAIIKQVSAAFSGNEDKLRFKFHPASPVDRLKALLPDGAQVTSDDLSHLFSLSRIVIGSGSGALLEAAVAGCMVIVLRSQTMTNYSYLPDLGKGVLWEDASSPDEIIRIYNNFSNTCETNLGERDKCIERLVESCFARPTEKKIVSSFDLDKSCQL